MSDGYVQTFQRNLLPLPWMSVLSVMVEASFSDTSQTIYKTTRRHIPQDGCLRNYRCGNLKSFSGQSASCHKDIFDIQEYSCRRYLEERDQLNNIALQFLPHSKQASTIFFTKISRLTL